MIYKVIIYDRDYHTIVEEYYMPFDDDAAAEEYAKKNSWTGETYYVKKVEDK